MATMKLDVAALAGAPERATDTGPGTLPAAGCVAGTLGCHHSHQKYCHGGGEVMTSEENLHRTG